MELPPQIRIAPTADGSPTAWLGEATETMHSLEGALGETRYLYETAVRQALQRGWSARVIAVGLGLGYVELMLAAVLGQWESALDAQAKRRFAASIHIESFESEVFLRESFDRWVSSESAALGEVHDAVAARIAGAMGETAGSLRDRLVDWRNRGNWILRGALDRETEFSQPASVLIFDAFSHATSPQLWDREFLQDFLQRAAHPNCLFSSYAARSALKDTLRAAGFSLVPRRGFGRKRESTLAER